MQMLQKLMKRTWKSEQAVNTKRAERQKNQFLERIDRKYRLL